MRYKNTTILSKENKKYYKGKIYPQIPLSENDLYVIITVGDRLDILSNTYYKDPSLWWIISIANSNVISQGTLFPTPGTQIRIPTNISNILDQYEKLNKIR